MKRLDQLSLFEETKPPPKPPLEQVRELPPEPEPILPPSSRRTVGPRKLQKLDAERFDELAVWLHNALQPFVSRKLVVKRIYGRTRFVQMKVETGEMVLRLHRRFIDAPEPVRDALVNWLKGPRRKPPKLVELYIHELSTLAATEQRLHQPRTDLEVVGKYYRLDELYNDVNQTYFGGSCRVAIGWGRRTILAAKSRHLGSYSAAHHRITIHPILDDNRIPLFVVQFVIFHELLHSRQSPGTRRPHDKSFREIERSHPDFQRVKEWEKDYFGKARC